MSSINFKNGPQVGKYKVDIQGFEQIVLPELNRKSSDVDVFLIDEIGKMECFSQKFVDAILRILDDNVPVVATVALKGNGFIAEVKSRKDIRLIEITYKNRDYIVDEIVGWL
ncbi:MAG: hypothetical protein A2161_02540 [Candidatus Schekmanbacteria bacterium RBG_13_48_7]|uniref:AAA domain-containing protein n=1 Tax=Candidatus Schekmanbacteria bacterium RBG_13_48_7 TaxID=1817878 RepID=A0A1F7RJM6_9BACT|nr:MAG: hypothetical protein A2161_02540 [Candidatus Schekmanbacteria bacterium RBG_13_48_7]